MPVAMSELLSTSNIYGSPDQNKINASEFMSGSWLLSFSLPLGEQKRLLGDDFITYPLFSPAIFKTFLNECENILRKKCGFCDFNNH